MNLTGLTRWNTWYTEGMLTHVLLPWGFAINLSFRKKSSGDILKNPLINRDPPMAARADIRSFDGSYTCLKLRHGTTPIKVESAVRDGEQVLLITPDGYYISDEQLIVETAFLWGCDGTLVKKNGKLGAVCPDGQEIWLYSNTEPYSYYLPTLQSPSLFFTLDAPVVISTKPYTTEEACRLMGESRRAVLLEAEKYGAHSESYLAMQSVLGWNTIYDPPKDRICSPVSRNWNKNVSGKLFCWDTFFAAEMFSLENRELSYRNIRAMLDEMTADGMIPNCSNSGHDRSQPLVGSMCVERIFERYSDMDFLREVYPGLYRWNTWYYENRMREDGYMCWGSGTRSSEKGTLFGAKCESGMDNSPPFDDAVYDAESRLMLQADVGASGLFIKDCKALLHMAELLGRTEDISALRVRKERAEDALMRLWNEEDGFFENLDLVTLKWVRRFTPMNFFALFSDRVSEEQKRRMMDEHLLNPAEFWGEYVLPSVHRGDYAFSEQHYWRGRIWAPLNALVYKALKDAGLFAEAKLLAEKSENLFLREWREHRHVHENYGAIDGMGCTARQSDAFYHWGALLGYIALDDVSDDRPLFQNFPYVSPEW
ncbi:MAG: hypothetical protein IJ489_10730 [Clostridia bacterium]|nr:hypothetical protein [Clostridia bacterium]